jgi:hypothetical protein
LDIFLNKKDRQKDCLLKKKETYFYNWADNLELMTFFEVTIKVFLFWEG